MSPTSPIIEIEPENLVENTAETAKTDPLKFLSSAVRRGSPGAIEAQEAKGQAELVGSDILPKDNRDREFFIKLGFVFKGDVPGDDLFEYVIFPKGWSKRATEHAMHTDILDPEGRVRGGIFYKAAFYDRKAGCSLKRRYEVVMVEGTKYPNDLWAVRDNKTGCIVFAPKNEDAFCVKHPGHNDENRTLTKCAHPMCAEELNYRRRSYNQCADSLQHLDNSLEAWDKP
jgi:hypothetical protein